MSDAHSGRSASLVTLGRRTSAHVVRLVSNRNRNAAYKLLGFVVPICGEPFCPFGTRPLASDVVQHRRLSPLLVHTVSDSYNVLRCDVSSRSSLELLVETYTGQCIKFPSWLTTEDSFG
jgi:hypothetical protein